MCITSSSNNFTLKITGYNKKLQPVAKPIYKKGRIVLGGNSSDTSYQNFVNANKVELFYNYLKIIIVVESNFCFFRYLTILY